MVDQCFPPGEGQQTPQSPKSNEVTVKQVER